MESPPQAPPLVKELFEYVEHRKSEKTLAWTKVYIARLRWGCVIAVMRMWESEGEARRGEGQIRGHTDIIDRIVGQHASGNA
jgi:hypothetical protein